MGSVSAVAIAGNPHPIGAFARFPSQLLQALGDAMLAPGVRVLVDYVVELLGSVSLADQASGLPLSVRGLAAALGRQPTQIHRSLHTALSAGILVRLADGDGYRYQLAALASWADRNGPERANTGPFSRWPSPLAYVAACGERFPPGSSPGLSTAFGGGVHTEVNTIRARASSSFESDGSSKDSASSAESHRIDLWYVWTAHPTLGRRIPLTWVVAELLAAELGPAWPGLVGEAPVQLVSRAAELLTHRDITPAQWTIPALRAAILRARDTAAQIAGDQAAERERLAAAEIAAAELARRQLAARVVAELKDRRRFRRDVRKLESGDFAELDLLAALCASGDLQQLGGRVEGLPKSQVGRQAAWAGMPGDSANPVLGHATIGGLGSEPGAQAVSAPQAGAELSELGAAIDGPGDGAGRQRPGPELVTGIQPPEHGSVDGNLALLVGDHHSAPGGQRRHRAELRMAHSRPDADQGAGAGLVGLRPPDVEEEDPAILRYIGPPEGGEFATPEGASPADQKQRPIPLADAGVQLANCDQARELGHADRAGLALVPPGLAAADTRDHRGDIGPVLAPGPHSCPDAGEVALNGGAGDSSVGELGNPGGQRRGLHRPGRPGSGGRPVHPRANAGAVFSPGLGGLTCQQGAFDPGELARVQGEIRAWREKILCELRDKIHPGKQ